MKNALHDLWLNNTEDFFGRNRDHAKVKGLTALIQRNREKLCDSLTDEQKAALEKYDDCYAELHDFYFEQIFSEGFRLGTQLALAGFL